MSKLQRKAVACLCVASRPPGSRERIAVLRGAASMFSMKAMGVKMQELVRRGYIEPLRQGTATGGLTEKGRRALQAAQQASYWLDLTIITAGNHG